MADDLMAQLEEELEGGGAAVDEDDLMAQLEREVGAPAASPSRLGRLADTYVETRKEALSPRTLARRLPVIGPAVGAFLTGAEELGALTGSETLYELGSGQKMLTAEDLARLPPEQRKAAERRQRAGLVSGALEVGDMVQGIGALIDDPSPITSDPLGFAADLGTLALEDAMRTDARGGIRREAPVSSSLDLVTAGQVGTALAKAPSVGARALQTGLPAVGRRVEKVGQGFGKRASEIRAAESTKTAKGLAEDAQNLSRRARALPETSQAKKLKLELDKARSEVAAIDAEFRARNIHTREAGEWASLEGRIFDAVKEVRRLDPEVQAATRAAWDARRGLGEFRMTLEHLLPEEQARLFRTLDDEALKAVFDSSYTPKVEAQRGVMKGAQRKAATSEVAGAERARGFLARLQKARRVEAKLEESYAKAVAKARDAEIDIRGRHVDADAAAQTALADASDLRKAVAELPETATSSWLRRIARASPGERNIVDEAAVGIGGGGLKGAAAGIIAKIAGDWTNDAAAMQRVASALVRRGRSMQQAEAWADVVGPALRESGTAGGISAVRALMEAGEIEPDAAAEIVEALAAARSTEEQARSRRISEVLR